MLLFKHSAWNWNMIIHTMPNSTHFPNGTIFKLDHDYMMNKSERTNILDIESRTANILSDYKEYTDKLLHQYPE